MSPSKIDVPPASTISVVVHWSRSIQGGLLSSHDLITSESRSRGQDFKSEKRIETEIEFYAHVEPINVCCCVVSYTDGCNTAT